MLDYMSRLLVFPLDSSVPFVLTFGPARSLYQNTITGLTNHGTHVSGPLEQAAIGTPGITTSQPFSIKSAF